MHGKFDRKSQRQFMGYVSAVHGRPVRRAEFSRRMADQLAANRAFISRPDAGLLAGNAPFRLDGLGRAICFISPHWGNYTLSFASCAFALPEGSRFLALRGNRWNDDEDGFWQKLNRSSSRHVEILRTDSGRNLLPALRTMRGGTHLFALYDLFSSFGETARIRLFDSAVFMTIGWARLCYLADAVVVSIAPACLDRPDVEFLDIADPRAFQSRDAFVAHCQRLAARSLEQLVAEQPAYWFMWEHLEKYLEPGGKVAAPLVEDRRAEPPGAAP